LVLALRAEGERWRRCEPPVKPVKHQPPLRSLSLHEWAVVVQTAATPAEQMQALAAERPVAQMQAAAQCKQVVAQRTAHPFNPNANPDPNRNRAAAQRAVNLPPEAVHLPPEAAQQLEAAQLSVTLNGAQFAPQLASQLAAQLQTHQAEGQRAATWPREEIWWPGVQAQAQAQAQAWAHAPVGMAAKAQMQLLEAAQMQAKAQLLEAAQMQAKAQLLEAQEQLLQQHVQQQQQQQQMQIVQQQQQQQQMQMQMQMQAAQAQMQAAQAQAQAQAQAAAQLYSNQQYHGGRQLPPQWPCAQQWAAAPSACAQQWEAVQHGVAAASMPLPTAALRWEPPVGLGHHNEPPQAFDPRDGPFTACGPGE
jgi:hypothetical protein